jgi:uncharacterized protein YbjT (DUF2867 family)
MASIDRVLVAGATGYLGGFIVGSLRQHNIAVVALVMPSTKGDRRERLTSLGATMAEADACQPQTLNG